MNIFIEMSFLGLLILILSLFLPKTKPNYFFGFRTAISLSDSEIWKKTNKIGAIITSISS
ncbi:MAG: SdpI family protein, partial [Caldisericia bacterium]|nr:SdpI family protein [Caldisericia bacterium]